MAEEEGRREQVAEAAKWSREMRVEWMAAAACLDSMETAARSANPVLGHIST